MKVSKTCEGQNIGSAYTIMEVLVAVFVMAVIGLAYYAALASGFALVQSTREDLRATQIMTQKIEALRLCAWSQLANVTFKEGYDPLASTNTGTVFYGAIALAAPASITNNPAYYGNIKQATISLAWTNYNGKIPIAHSRQMQTHVARYGLQNYVWGAQ